MNIQALKTYLNCDNGFLLSLVQKFVEELNDTTNKITLAWQNQNLTSIKLNAHKLLSSVKVMQLKELTLSLEKIETGAASKHISSELEEDIKQLDIQVKKVINDLQLTIEELEANSPCI